MAELTPEQKTALDHARHLAEHGAPIFVARADTSALGFRLPPGWQRTEPNPSVVNHWRAGDALCLVTGVLVDVVDVDPRNGGDRAALNGSMPNTYGQQSTPSGGTHDLIAPLGIPKGKASPGIDVQAGDPSGEGRGFVFLAPTERPSKVTGEVRSYEWVIEPDVGMLLIGDDDSGTALRNVVASLGSPTYDGPDYDGPAYDDLTDAQRQQADRYVADLLDKWAAVLDEAQDWPEGQTDDRGRGWEALSRDFAWAVARLEVSPWTGLEDGGDVYDKTMPDAIAANEKCQGKWDRALVAKAARQPVEPPPWQTPFEPLTESDDGGSRPLGVDVTNESDSLRWLKAEVGRGRLSGVFRRGQELVHTPRIGEDGYVPPKDDRDSAGPAQVRRIDTLGLAARIDHGYSVTRTTRRSSEACMFPQAVAGRAAATPDLLRNARDLDGVTHTPVVRRDGSILASPGYDDASGMLYLPDLSLSVPQVSEQPSRDEVQKAGQMLLDMVADFPFITVHDRANYLGALLTPLLRPLVPPPYKLVAVGAPQRGSGKSLLAWIMRELHGGVFKSEFPGSDEELRKFVTSTLDATTGPVVQFDNVTGVLKSSVLDGLLTSPEWSDRRLGVNEMVTLPNDRLWVVTGNNVHIGGDLERRTLWVTINAGMERPEERTDFSIPDLEGWVRQHRGDLLWALLTLVRAWVAAGSPEPDRPTSDSFGRWVAVLRGILDVAGLEGVVGHAESIQKAADPEDEEWATFLAAVYRNAGSAPWTVKDLLAVVWDENEDFQEVRHDDRSIKSGDLPGDIGEKVKWGKVSAAKSLGKWLGNRNGRWADGLSAQMVPAASKKHAKQWRVVSADEDLLG